MSYELGLDSFGDVTVDAQGNPVPMDQVIRDVVEQAVLADQTGIHFIGLGEHHRPDFAISSPEVILAAIAARTSKIHLGTAVTVLSSDDPIRVFQRFSTLNALSNGRAEVILGRGSFTESYPLFGYDLNDYDMLFEEKLDLFAKLGLQLLVVTPLQKVHVIEPYVSAVGFVENRTGQRSRLQTLTIEEYHAERAEHGRAGRPS